MRALRFLVIALALLFWFPKHAAAQRVEDSCHAFFDDPHQSLDCVEALFTETDIPYGFPHLTVSSVPPGNGFPIGVVWDKRSYFVSSPFSDPNQPNKLSEGFKSLVDAKCGCGDFHQRFLVRIWRGDLASSDSLSL